MQQDRNWFYKMWVSIVAFLAMLVTFGGWEPETEERNKKDKK